MIGFSLGQWSGILSDSGTAEGLEAWKFTSLYILTMKMNVTPENLIRASSEQSPLLST